MRFATCRKLLYRVSCVNTVLVFSKRTIENGVLRNRATVTPHIPRNSDPSITLVRTVFNRRVIPSYDGDTRTANRPRVVPRSSASASILARPPCHLVRSSRIAVRVGSHHTPTHQIQLCRIATKSTTSCRSGRYHYCTSRARTIWSTQNRVDTSFVNIKRTTRQTTPFARRNGWS